MGVLGPFNQEEFDDFRLALKAAGYDYGEDAASNAFVGWKLAEYANANVVLHAPKGIPSAWQSVINERRRQIAIEGFTLTKDDEYDGGVLAAAGSAYALAAADALDPRSQGDGQFADVPPHSWPWSHQWWKPGTPRMALVKGTALMLAEIERHDREVVRNAKPAEVSDDKAD